MLNKKKKFFLFISLFAFLVIFFVSGFMTAALPVEGKCEGIAPISSPCYASIKWIVNEKTTDERTKAGGSDCGFYCSTTKTSCWIYFDGSYYYFLSGN